MSVSTRLRELIEALDVTQAQMARAYGRSAQQINNTLRNGRLSHDFAAWLAGVLGVNLNWLFTGEGPMFAPPDGVRLAEPQSVYQGEANEQLLVELAHRLGEEGRPFLEAVARRRLREAARQNDTALATEGDLPDE